MTSAEVDALTDDRTIQDAVDAAMQAPQNVLEAMFRALYEWRETGRPEPLTEFAEAALTTIDVHTTPGYEKALAAAPGGPTSRGRDPGEIFAAHGF